MRTANKDRPGLRLKLLGGFESRLATGAVVTLPTRKAQALLAYLAARPGQAHSRDKLAALLWPDRGDAQARDSLRHTLVELRKVLPAEPPGLGGEAGAVALDPAAVEVDVVRFECLVKAGHLAEAADLYDGDFLDGFVLREARFEEWLVTERERLREQALDALQRLLGQQCDAKSIEPAIRTALRLLALDATQETAHRALMQLYAQQGRRAAALRQYQTCVTVLQRELGTEPEAVTRHVYREIVQQRVAAADGRPASPTAKSPERPRPAIRPASAMVESPFIGRDDELQQLRNRLDDARWGRGRVIAIIGEAGVGKSRLVAELIRHATGADTRVLLARCHESEQILPFGPWVDALRAAHVVPDEPAVLALEPGWRAELARLFPEIPTSGLPAPSDDARRLFESVTHLVRSLAASQPVLVVLDDLHWADEISVRLLAYLGRRIAGDRVLLVATAREEELADAAALRAMLDEMRREGALDAMTLTRLSADQTATLVRSLAKLGTDPEALTRLEAQIWRVSAGNPFVVVETLRVLERVTVLDSTALPLPERVREVITASLGRLSVRARELANVAAVIGRDFDFALLQRASGLTDRDAASGAEELVRQRVLHGVGERFDFTHDRIREVIYAELLAPRRRLLHREVALAIESLPTDRVADETERLAYHALRGECWDKAVTHLRQAGLRAVARSAYREAVASLGQAIDTVGHLPESRETAELAVDLRLDLRSALLPLADVPRMLRCLGEAERIARALGDQRRLGIVLQLSVMPHVSAGHYEEALRCGRDALAIGAALADPAIEAPSLGALGMVHTARGELREAVEVLERNVKLLEGDLVYERFGQAVIPSAYAWCYLAEVLSDLGRFDEALAHAEQAVRISKAAGHRPFSLSFGLLNIGLTCVRRGDGPRAIPSLELALELCRMSEAAVRTASVTATLGAAYALAGRLDEALMLVRNVLEDSQSHAHHRQPGLVRLLAGMVCRLAGRLDEADAHARDALALARRLGGRGREAEGLLLSGEIALGTAGEDAEPHFRAALALASERGMRPLVARCHLGLGTLSGRLGKREAAREHLGVAATMLREMDMRFWMDRAEAGVRAHA